MTWAFVAVDDQRIYWNSRSQKPLPETGMLQTRLWSTSRTEPEDTVDHGPFSDAEGHAPWFLGDLASDGRGRLYTCGRWYARPDEYETIGVNRNGLMCAVYFSVLQV